MKIMWIALIRYRIAWWRWFLGPPPYRLGDPLLGSGETRDANRKLIWERYDQKEPKPEDYGLPKSMGVNRERASNP